MVRCEKCLKFFEVDELLPCYLVDPETDYPELKDMCPDCGGIEFSNARRCPRCKELHVEDYDICENCVQELKAELENFLKKYSEDEQEAMFS